MGVNQVLSKIAKINESTELSSHEVLLADFADIKIQLDKAEGEYKKILDYSNKIFALSLSICEVKSNRLEFYRYLKKHFYLLKMLCNRQLHNKRKKKVTLRGFEPRSPE